jgi:hypothetical protein
MDAPLSVSSPWRLGGLALNAEVAQIQADNSSHRSSPCINYLLSNVKSARATRAFERPDAVSSRTRYDPPLVQCMPF